MTDSSSRRLVSRRAPLIIVAALLAAGIPLGLSAVIVSPTAVFLSDRERSTQITLFNSSATAEEITLELKYGYPDTDSTGAVVYRLIDSPAPEDPSAAGFIAMYPRRMTLAPGARQVVRLVATPPAGLLEGEYWGRFVVRSNPQSIVDLTGADPGVRAGLQLEMRTVIPVLFRKGSVQTGVAVRSLSARAIGDSILVLAEIAREGNAAYLGNALFEVRDAAGRVRHSSRTTVAIHLDQRRRLAIPLAGAAGLAAQGLSLHLTFTSDRGDLPSSKILRTPRVTASTTVSPA